MRKNQDINRLHEHRLNKRIRDIETLERNRPHVTTLMMNNNQQLYPGVVSMAYNSQTHCLTIRYIGLCVQWYAHTEKVHIQHGNEKPGLVSMTHQQLQMRLLHSGRKGFA